LIPHTRLPAAIDCKNRLSIFKGCVPVSIQKPWLPVAPKDSLFNVRGCLFDFQSLIDDSNVLCSTARVAPWFQRQLVDFQRLSDVVWPSESLASTQLHYDANTVRKFQVRNGVQPSSSHDHGELKMELWQSLWRSVACQLHSHVYGDSRRELCHRHGDRPVVNVVQQGGRPRVDFIPMSLNGHGNEVDVRPTSLLKKSMSSQSP